MRGGRNDAAAYAESRNAAAVTDRGEHPRLADIPTADDRLAAFRMLAGILAQPRSTQPLNPLARQTLALVRDNRSPREIAMALGITINAVAGLLAQIVG